MIPLPHLDRAIKRRRDREGGPFVATPPGRNIRPRLRVAGGRNADNGGAPPSPRTEPACCLRAIPFCQHQWRLRALGEVEGIRQVIGHSVARGERLQIESFLGELEEGFETVDRV
jgi:hypothetical protein